MSGSYETIRDSSTSFPPSLTDLQTMIFCIILEGSFTGRTETITTENGYSGFCGAIDSEEDYGFCCLKSVISNLLPMPPEFTLPRVNSAPWNNPDFMIWFSIREL